MSRSGREPTDAGSKRRLVLAMDEGRNRRILAEWLEGFSQYEVATPSSPAGVPDGFDLCLCDDRSIGEFRSVLERRQREADPVFLPYVLLVSEDVTAAPVELRDDIEQGTDLEIQELVASPVDQRELQRRIDNLLRARTASLRLAERTQQYSELVRLAPEAIVIVRDERVVYANESAAVLFGHDDGDDLTDASLSRYLPDDDATFREMLDEIRVSGSTGSHAEAQVLGRDGGVRDVEVTGVKILFDGDEAEQLIIRDVTEKRQRQQQLTLFERAIETAVQGITIVDARQPDLPLVYINEAFEDITGYSAAECLGKNCRFLQGGGTDAETVATVRDALESESPASVELLNYRKDGTPFWNRLDIVPVRDEDGEVTHFLGLQRDVTGRIEREQRLSVLDRVLRHNLRNRGNVIRAHADQIRTGATDSPAEDAERIVDSIDDLLSISDEVRQFRSLVTAESVELVEFDVVSLLERVGAGHEVGAAITFDLPESAPVQAHPMLPFGFGELLDRVAEDGSDIRVRVQVGPDAVTVEWSLPPDVLSGEELDVLRRVRETPLGHDQGLTMWLTLWTVEGSNGDLILREDDDGITLSVTLPAAEPE